MNSIIKLLILSTLPFNLLYAMRSQVEQKAGQNKAEQTTYNARATRKLIFFIENYGSDVRTEQEKIEEFEAIMKEHPDVNAIDGYLGYSILCWAAIGEASPKIFEILLEKGANPLQASANDQIPRHMITLSITLYKRTMRREPEKADTIAKKIKNLEEIEQLLLKAEQAKAPPAPQAPRPTTLLESQTASADKKSGTAGS